MDILKGLLDKSPQKRISLQMAKESDWVSGRDFFHEKNQQKN